MSNRPGRAGYRSWREELTGNKDTYVRGYPLHTTQARMRSIARWLVAAGIVSFILWAMS